VTSPDGMKQLKQMRSLSRNLLTPPCGPAKTDLSLMAGPYRSDLVKSPESKDMGNKTTKTVSTNKIQSKVEQRPSKVLKIAKPSLDFTQTYLQRVASDGTSIGK